MLQDIESTRGERNGTIRVKESGVTVTLEEWDDQTGLPSGRDDGEPQDEVEEREEQVTPPGEGNFESGVRRPSAPGEDSWHLESAATSSL